MNTHPTQVTKQLKSEFTKQNGWKLMRRFNLRKNMVDHVAQQGEERVLISFITGDTLTETDIKDFTNFVNRNRKAGWNVRAILITPEFPEMILPNDVEIRLTGNAVSESFLNGGAVLVA